MADSKRIEWIDLCKGLGIFLVVIGHTSIAQISQTLYDWIYSFHMPMFYMLSGMVFNPAKYNSFRTYLQRRVKTLVIPFFILNTILYLCARWANLPNIQPPMSELLTGVLAMYFIRVLFVSELWYYGCCRFLKNGWLRIAVIVGLIIISHLFHFRIGWWSILIPSMPLLFYALGHLLKESLDNSKDKVANKFLVAICVGTLWVSLLAISYTHSFYTSILLALVGSATLISLSIVLSKRCTAIVKDKIKFIGENTLVIVAAHQIIYNSMKLITGQWINNAMLEGCVRMCLLWVVLILVIILFNRHFYWVLGKQRRS